MKFNSEVIIFSLFSVHLTYTTRNEESSMKNARSILFSPLEATQAFGMEIVDHPSLSLARLTRMSFVYSFFFFLLQIAGLVKYLKCYKPHLTSFIYLFWEYNWKCSGHTKLNNGSFREFQMVISFHFEVRFRRIIYRDARN